MNNYIANEQLDTELQVSKLLKGMNLPVDYLNIRSLFCQISILDVSLELDQAYIELMKCVSDKNMILKDKEMEKFYLGDNIELMSKLLNLIKVVISSEQSLQNQIESKVLESINKLEYDMQGQDFFGMGDAINATQSEKLNIEGLNAINLELKKQRGILNAIFTEYGAGDSKLSNKKIAVNLSNKYKLFLNNLGSHADEMVPNVNYAIVLGKTLDAIYSIIPKDNELNPFNIDVANNFLKAVTNPEDFYKEAKNGHIISQQVGKLFGQCYPEFYHKYLDIFLENFDKIPYQEQINIRNSFGIPEDNSQIINLCAVSLMATPQQQGA